MKNAIRNNKIANSPFTVIRLDVRHTAIGNDMKEFLQAGFLIICSLFFTTALGQGVASPPTPQATPRPVDDNVVKISTTLIQIDATVLDRNGDTVKGLTADDFEIYENNKRQPITTFSFVELQPERSTSSVTARPDKNSPPVPPIPSKLRQGQVRRTIALVVDDLGLSFTSIDVVRSALKKFVDEQMQHGDLVAIIRTSRGAGALQQFTADKRILYAAIKRVKWSPNGSGGVSAFAPYETTLKEQMSGGSLVDSVPQDSMGERESNREFDQIREDFFTVGTLGAVNYLLTGMRELPGRKAVVLFSDGLKLLSTYRTSEGKKIKSGLNQRLITAFQHLTDLATRSAVVIYTMDARGVVNPMLTAEDSIYLDRKDEASERLELAEMERGKALLDTQQGLRVLAEQTGGFAVINNNNLSKGIERVLNDQKGYYLLGYQPDSESFDPKKARFYRLNVKLKRPGLKVRFRSGFFGIGREVAERARLNSPYQQILAALVSPLETAGIDLRLTSLFTNDPESGILMRSLLYVNGGDLKFTEEPDGWQKATFDIVAMTFGDNGTIVDEVSRRETIKAKADTLKEIREKGFVATIDIPIKKTGGYQLRVVMRDTATSRIGSANQFIEVPNLKKKQLALSGIVMQRYPAKPAETSSKKPFQTDAERDAATRRFRPGDTLRFDLSIYNAKIDKTSKPNLVMEYKIYRDGKEIFSAPGKALSVGQGSALRDIEASGVFELGKKMTSGDYVLQVIIKDLLAKEKSQIATQWADFEVVF